MVAVNRPDFVQSFMIAIFGVIVGLVMAGAIALSVGPREVEVEVEVEVETIICPPVVDAATRFRLFFEGMPPEPGPLDYEFLEACGFETFEPPMKIEPPESGA